MDISLIILLVVLVIFYSLYAKGIRLKNSAQEAASSIDVQLQKRRDLIPNVLKLAGKYMAHEKELLSELTALRAKTEDSNITGDMAQAMSLDGSITSAMGRFFAVAENYPDLKASDNIEYAQKTFSEVEGHIAASRRFYNSAVTDVNNYCETFPTSMLTGMTGAAVLPYFEASEEAKEPIDVDDYL
jgi:LemA protein